MEATHAPRLTDHNATDWHRLAVGVLVLIWSLMAFAKYGPLGLATTEVTGWAKTYVAASVWGSFAGSVLLLLRSRFAVQAFVTSIVGIMAASFTLVALNHPPHNIFNMPAMFGLWVIAQTSLLYALRIRSRGLLR